MTKLDVNACNNADRWLNGCIDESTKQEILRMREENPEEFNDAFYRTLEFGTGGLRGIMGLGTNRMNFITVSMTTQGFCNYIKQKKTQGEIRCVISHDSRNNSRNFALTTARVMAANGFKVFLFEDMRPTPELSFAVRELKADAGVMITASHNPKEYNGYKAYWNDGAQLTAPDDELVIEQVNQITDISQVKTQQGDENITIIGKDIDQVYIDRVKSLSLDNGYISRNKGLKIVYTPLHGTGIKLIPQALKAYGFDNVSIVEPQAVADGNFPTCVSPNPEEPAALELGLQQAQRENADILLATDPDADREARLEKPKPTQFGRHGCGKFRRRLLSHRGKCAPRLAHGFFGGLYLGIKLPDLPVAILEVGKLLRPPVAQRKDVRHGGARVLALEPAHERYPVVQRLEHGRIRVYQAHRVGDRAGQLLHGRYYPLKLIAPLVRGGVVFRHLADAAFGKDEQIRCGGITGIAAIRDAAISRESGICRIRGLDDL